MAIGLESRQEYWGSGSVVPERFSAASGGLPRPRPKALTIDDQFHEAASACEIPLLDENEFRNQRYCRLPRQQHQIRHLVRPSAIGIAGELSLYSSAAFEAVNSVIRSTIPWF